MYTHLICTILVRFENNSLKNFLKTLNSSFLRQFFGSCFAPYKYCNTGPWYYYMYTHVTRLHNGNRIFCSISLYITVYLTQCDQTVALTQFFQDIVWSGPPKVGFIGAGCENATIETAKISYFFNLTQVGVVQPTGHV